MHRRKKAPANGKRNLVDDQIRRFFDWLAPKLLQGDLEWLEHVYDYPLSFFTGNEIRIENGPADMAAYILARRDHAQIYGISTVSAEVIQITATPGNARFTVIVDYLFHLHDGSKFGRNQSRYRCRFDEDDQIRVESVEILKVGLPHEKAFPQIVRH